MTDQNSRVAIIITRSDHHSLPVPCYTGEYEIWHRRMQTHLESLGLWDIVNDEEGPSSPPTHERKKKAKMALRIIQQGVPDSDFLDIFKSEYTEEPNLPNEASAAWKAVEKFYKPRSLEKVGPLHPPNPMTLYYAAMVGNMVTAKEIVRGDLNLLTTPNPSNGLFPVHIAAMNRHKEMTAYLIDQMINAGEGEANAPLHKIILGQYAFDEDNGVLLLNLLITAGFYDEAERLLTGYDNFFRKETALRIRPADGEPRPNQLAENIANFVCLADKFGKRPLQTFADRPLSGDLIAAKKLITRICELMRDGFPESNDLSDVLWPPLLTATQLGIQEIVVAIINTHRPMIWIKDRHNRTIFHHAVQYRQEKVFDLLLDLEQEEKHQIVQFVSEIDNSNILHLAARMKSSTPAYTSRATLQMRHELLWFEEVKKLVPLSFQNEQMTPENKTPIQVFKDEHTQLAKDGETWIETTASAYSFVAALIVTVLFATAFQVPGGNAGDGVPYLLHNGRNKSDGVPNFLNNGAPGYFIYLYMIIIMGLLSSSSSLMIFLGILTSRNSEADFLLSLPRQLIWGLVTLYLALFFMMTAFFTAIYLYAEHLSNSIILRTLLALPPIPGFFFLKWQLPLFFELKQSNTYMRDRYRPGLLTVPTSSEASTPQQNPGDINPQNQQQPLLQESV